MARYIDADKLIKEVGSLEQLARKRVYDTPTSSPVYERYSTQYTERETMLSIIKEQPTANVAPRAEVARELGELIKDGIYMTLRAYCNMDAICLIDERIDEAVKKYESEKANG